MAGDERLLALVRSGDERAFEAIYERHHARILSFCRQMLGSRADAEDAAQQCFISAYRSIVADERRIEVRPWLYAIARNRCLSMLRARRELGGIFDDGPDRATAEGLAEVVQRRDDLRELVADIATLPENQRAALVLTELGDLSHRQLAGVLDCQPERVKALVFQARTSLMAQRRARALTCEEICLRLANARGHELLRGDLRRHLRTCAGCRAYAAEVKRQRAALALILPVLPTAGLKAATLGAALGSHGAAGINAGAASGLALAGAKGAVLKGLAALALAGAAAGVGAAALLPRHHRSSAGRPSSAPARRAFANPARGGRVAGTRLGGVSSAPVVRHGGASGRRAARAFDAPVGVGATGVAAGAIGAGGAPPVTGGHVGRHAGRQTGATIRGKRLGATRRAPRAQGHGHGGGAQQRSAHSNRPAHARRAPGPKGQGHTRAGSLAPPGQPGPAATPGSSPPGRAGSGPPGQTGHAPGEGSGAKTK